MAAIKNIDLSSGYKIRNEEGIFYLTLQVVLWVDIFSRQNYRDIIIDSLRFAKINKGLNVHAYVIMSNHVHMIVSVKEGKLSKVIGEFKSYTSKQIIEHIKDVSESRRTWLLELFGREGKISSRNKSYKVWTHENHPVELESTYFFDQKLNYIHENLVRAGLVYKAEDYVYSSASAYAGMESILEIEIDYLY
ncbi:transposase [Cytophagaceae bacterium ABcell3]|nr:transposase [Cytophagaceae bacterium ABcell3]